jgi:hypothetical protein
MYNRTKPWYKIVKKSFDVLERFRCLEKSLTDQNCIQEKIKSRLNSGNACYHSVQTLYVSRLLSRNVNIKIYKPQLSEWV